MAGCVLRIVGKNLNVNALLATIPLRPYNIDIKGQSHSVFSKRIATASGFDVSVSDASGSDVQGQIRDAIVFLSNNREILRQAVEYPGVDCAYLDFGIYCRISNEILGQFDYYPPDLLRLAGEIGLGIEISLYSVSESDS